MLKADSQLWRTPVEAIVYPALFLVLGSWFFKGVPPWQAILGAGGLSILRVVFWAVREFRGVWLAEQRRKAAAKRALWVPLAWPQPEPGSTVLPLPCAIFSKYSWLAYLFFPLLIWGLLVLFFSWFWFANGPFVDKLILSACIAPLSILSLADYTRLEVSEEGLTIRTRFTRKSIRWQDARLFAIAATVKPDKTPDHYELSSATTILRWSRDLKPSRMTWRSCTFPEYARQMDALLALICQKTGLPLYDLRDWGSQKELPPEYLPLPVPQYPPPFSPEGSYPNVPNA